MLVLKGKFADVDGNHYKVYEEVDKGKTVRYHVRTQSVGSAFKYDKWPAWLGTNKVD